MYFADSQGVYLTIHFHLVQRLGMHETMCSHTHMSCGMHYKNFILTSTTKQEVDALSVSGQVISILHPQTKRIYCIQAMY
jgi:hypothetical protein